MWKQKEAQEVIDNPFNSTYLRVLREEDFDEDIELLHKLLNNIV